MSWETETKQKCIWAWHHNKEYEGQKAGMEQDGGEADLWDEIQVSWCWEELKSSETAQAKAKMQVCNWPQGTGENGGQKGLGEAGATCQGTLVYSQVSAFNSKGARSTEGFRGRGFLGLL